jgi:SPP1 family phage portal protein
MSNRYIISEISNPNYILQDKLITMSDDEELTISVLEEMLGMHKQLIHLRYKKLKEAYIGAYPIWKQPNKAQYKPDNRVVVNFAKYIVDTMNGFFIGVPVKVQSSDEAINDYLTFLSKYNDQEDNDAELSKICSIYGKGYEVYYNDSETGQIGITYMNPTEGFMVYDDTNRQLPRYFINYYYDSDNVMHGEIRDKSSIMYFNDEGTLHFEERVDAHNFSDIPATEFIENEERMSIFEPSYAMINEYNKALSEKANDVDYFADAYMKILGANLDESTLNAIRDNRIINLSGDDSSSIVVDFMDKPNADTTQENLIQRLERLIFQTSMVANISDDNFATTSGIALKYKLLSMSNLAKTKERKFTSGMNRRYKVIFSNPINAMNADDWVHVDYTFTQNFPNNLQEEAQIAQQLSGIVSQQTQLSVLSNVKNPRDEMNLIQKEQEEQTDTNLNYIYPTQGAVDEQTE